ncbi:MAG: DNA repair exonuclease [Gemmatimonadetes bacterium]|nr:DNA repair exonuclease [Gemmatimonadota bacterium]
MRLAHLADLHLGFRRYTRQTAHGINQREADVAAAFRLAVDEIAAVKPDIVIVAGDVFHSVRPSNPAILDSFNQFRRLGEMLPDTPVVIIAGNHDTPRSVETGTILTLFEALPNVHVAASEPRRLVFEALDLSVLCVPHSAIRASPRPSMRPEEGFKWNVMVTHCEVAGVVPGDRSFVEYGGALVEPGDLHADEWDYVALGHYHVAQRVTSDAWYSGSLEFVSFNPWGELQEGDRLGWGGAKGWLLATLRDGRGTDVEFRPLQMARRHIDLEVIDGVGKTAADLDELIANRIAGIPGGLDDQVVRQLVPNVTRHVARDLNHAAIREYKACAVHYHLDVRRPGVRREVGVSAPGKQMSLDEIVTDYLERREIAPGVERAALVSLGRRYLEQVEREITEG